MKIRSTTWSRTDNTTATSYFSHERAKMFTGPGMERFTLGTGALEEGITNFKKSLGPSEVIPYSYLLTGERKKNDKKS